MGFLREWYEKTFDSPESRGLLVLGVLLAVVLVLAFFFGQQFLQPQKTSTLEVTVISQSGEAVAGATVRLFDAGGNFIEEKKSDKNGKAVFDSVPPRAVVRALKQGFDESSAVATGGSLRLELQAEQDARKISIHVRVSDAASSKPVIGARLSYSYKGGKAAEASSDSNGKALVSVPENRVVSLAVSHADYQQKTVSFLSKRRSAAVEVKLSRLAAGAPKATPPATAVEPEFGSLEVLVSDEEGNAVDGASVEVYDASTNSLLSAASSSGGRALFDGLAVGSKVFLVVKAAGFKTSLGRQKITVSKSLRFEVVLRREGSSAEKFRVKTADTSGKEIPAEVRLYSVSLNRLVKRAQSDGQVEYSLDDIKDALGASYSESDSYYAAASSSGFLPAVSETFSMPFNEDVTLFLQPAGDSAVLSVNARDAERNLLSGAAIRVMDEFGSILYEAEAASKDFKLAKGSKYRIEIESSGEKGFGRVLLLKDTDYDVFLGEQPVFLLVNALDAVSGNDVNADFASSYSGQEFDACSGFACYLRIKRFSTAEVKAFAAGYADYSTEVSVTAEDEREQALYLVKPEEVKGSFVKFLGVFDVLGAEVKQLEAGQEFTAKFLVASKDAAKTGVFFRVGNESKSSDGSAYITAFSSNSKPAAVYSSASYSPSSCAPSEGLVEEANWVSLAYDGKLAEEVSFKFKLRDALKGKKSLSVFYRVFAQMADGTTERFPASQTSLPETPENSCSGETLSETLPLSQEKEFKCKELGCLSLYLEQDGLVGKEDFQARTIPDCDSSCENCENSCTSAQLFVRFDFEPSPAYARDSFDFQLGQAGGKLEFKQLTINAGQVSDTQKSTAYGSLSGQKRYSAYVSSVPLEEGEETLTVELWKKEQEERKISDSVSFEILAGCGQGQRVCDDGSCAYYCLPPAPEDEETEPTPSPTPSPCPAGQQYCIDGECRADCGPLSPEGEPTPEPQGCVSDYYCDTGYCNTTTRTCSARPCSSSNPCPSGQSCSSGSCIPFQCSSDTDCGQGKICNPGGVCTSPPSPCSAPEECSPGYCDESTGLCVFPTPSPSATPTPSPAPCDYDWECYPATCDIRAGYCNPPSPTPSPTTEATPTPTIACTLNEQCPSQDCDQDTNTCIPTPAPESTPTPTPRPDVAFDIIAGKLVSTIQQIKMTADAVFPADAVTLKITEKCRVPLLAVDSSKGTSPCYSFDATTLIFKSASLNPSCPLGFNGDKPEPDDSAILRVSCAGDASNTLEIPVKVSVDESVKAVYVRPESLSGSASKLFHVISQTQGRRELLLNDEQRADFEQADAQSLAWSGDGLLSVTENGGLAAEVIYNPTEDYFPDISDQGGRVESCSDYFCCANGWCTESAARKAFEYFKQASEEISKKTVFRRSTADALPLKRITDKPFVYSTVIRLLQGTDLPAGITAVDQPSAYGCKGDNPKVYVVQASTYDGKTWEYVARVVRLYKYNYVEPPELAEECPVSDSTPPLPASATYRYQQSGGYLAVCDFLTGEGQCITTEPTASTASMDQTKEERQQRPIPVPSSFWRILLFNRNACKAATPPECSGASTIDVDLPGVLPFPRIQGMACVPGEKLDEPSAGCVPVCTPSQNYLFFTPFNNQMFAVVHLGLNKYGCGLDYKQLAVSGAAVAALYVPGVNNYRSYLDKIQRVHNLANFALAGDFLSCGSIAALSSVAPRQYQSAGSTIAGVCDMAVTAYKMTKSAAGVGGGDDDSGKGRKASKPIKPKAERSSKPSSKSGGSASGGSLSGSPLLAPLLKLANSGASGGSPLMALAPKSGGGSPLMAVAPKGGNSPSSGASSGSPLISPLLKYVPQPA